MRVPRTNEKFDVDKKNKPSAFYDSELPCGPSKKHNIQKFLLPSDKSWHDNECTDNKLSNILPDFYMAWASHIAQYSYTG